MQLHNRFFFNQASEQGSGDGGGSGGGSTLLGGAAGSQGGAGDATQQRQVSSSSGEADEHSKGGAFDFRASLDDKGNFKQDWTKSLPDDLKQAEGVLSKYPNPVEALRGLANAQKLIGQKSTLKAPAPDAKPEEVEKFNSQLRDVLGIPQKAEDYKLTTPEKLPEGLTWDEAKAGDFAKLAHSLNIPPAAADKIAAWQMQQMAGMVDAGKAKLDAWVQSQTAELKKDWGADFDANLGKAAKAAQIAGFDLNDGELANNAKFIKAMLTVSNLIKPDALVGADKAGNVMDGKAQAEDIRRNPSNPWHNAFMGKEGPARQKEAAALMARLQGVQMAA